MAKLDRKGTSREMGHREVLTRDTSGVASSSGATGISSIYERRRLNLRLVIGKDFGNVQARLGEALGMADGSFLSRLLSGKKTIGNKLARRIEELAGRPANFLDVEPREHFLADLHARLQESRPGGPTANDESDATRSVSRLSNLVPVVSWGRLRDFLSGRAEGKKDEGDLIESAIPTAVPWHWQLFSVVMEGDAMSDGSSAGYTHGEYLHVDPTVEPRDGMDVIVELGVGRFTVRRLQLTHEGPFLKAANPLFPQPLQRMPAASRVVGVIVAASRVRRYA